MAIYTKISSKDIRSIEKMYNVGKIIHFKGIKKGIEKLKEIINPLSGLSSQKPQVPPLPNTPMPNVAATAMQKNPQTGLTRTETALLSPAEQVIARRT